MSSSEKPPKTFSEFEKFRQKLFASSFNGGTVHPLSFGVQRTQFQIERLQKLIEVAEGVEGVTIRERLKGWRRQLERLQGTRDRLQKLTLENMHCNLYHRRVSLKKPQH